MRDTIGLYIAFLRRGRRIVPELDRVVKRLAEGRGISEKTLLDEMQRAIDAGYASDDPAVRAAWKDTPFQTAPTPEELLRFLAGKIGQASRSR